MEKTIVIGETPVRFKASAATVRRYRETFQRDLLKDMTAVIEAAGNNQMTGAELETFENFAYLCAKAADPESVPASPDEWLDNFEMISIYEILPQLVDLWITGQKTLETPKKKQDRRSGN